MTSSTSGSDTSKVIKMMQKHIQKRSLDVKFDLEGTKYNPIENIGIGAYGVVCSAIHKKSKEKVAVKKIPNVFDVLVIAKRTHREIKILKHFKHDNIICIREILKPKEDFKDFRDIYVIFDLMESDLHKIIYSDQELSEEHSRYFLYQILRGLKYIHSANVVHRDLKPGNILVNEDCHVRIGDFGMSRGVFASPDEPSHFMTQYVATRWYRAPEILLSLVEYGTAVDMWSVGCIFAEMLGRKHLFPGKDYMSQIKLIIGVLGSPPVTVFNRCQNEVIKKILKTLGPKDAIPWKTLFPKASKKAIDLLGKMLVINPTQRITVVDAMKHPYLSKYHDPDDEPICLPAFNFDFEKEYMDKDKLREVIYSEIMEFHKPRTPTLSFSAFIRPAPKEGDNAIDNKPTEIKVPENSVTKIEKTSPLTDSNTASPFKRPADSIKTLPVSVDVQTFSSNDVEMLSAKSEMLSAKSVDMETQTCVVGLTPIVDKENKTISEDTKALIKKALLNSQWRQRHDSTGDREDKPKIITAAMRQRERQDKRREKEKQKKIRSRKKGEKGAKCEEIFLSEADKAMLRRWAEMRRKPEQPILPKPGTNVQPNVVRANVNDPKEPIPKKETNLDKATPPLTVNISPAHSPPEVLRIKEEDSTVPPRVLTPSNTPPQQTHSPPLQTTIPPHSTSDTPLIGTNVREAYEQTFPSGGQSQVICPQQTNVGTTDKSVSLPDTSQFSTNVQRTIPPPPPYDTTASNVLPANPSFSINETSENIRYTQPSEPVNTSVTSFTDSSTSSFNTSGQFTDSTISFHSDSSFASLNAEEIDLLALSKDLQSSIKCSLPITQNNFITTSANTCTPDLLHQSLDMYVKDSLDSNLNLNVGFTLDQDSNIGQSLMQSQPNTSNYSGSVPQIQASMPQFNQSQAQQMPELQSDSSNFMQSNHMVSHPLNFNPRIPLSQAQPIPDFSHGQQSSQQPNLSQYNQLPTFPNFTQTSNMAEAQPDQHVTQSNFHQFNAPDPQSYDQQNFEHQVNSNSTFFDSIQMTPPAHASHLPGTSTGSGLQQNWNVVSQSSQSSSFKSKASMPSLKVDCSSPERKPSPQANTQLQPDLIALLSKQMSKSLLENILPPALSLTPRGTGAGYGVGVDLESLLVEAQETSDSTAQSPLSSSLLADWLDVSGGNITIADLEELEQEMATQSPLPFRDLNL